MAPCTVSLVKTGDEAHLHETISFLPLFYVRIALLVDHQDCHSGLKETVVRVKFNVAVRFAHELLCKGKVALDLGG
jgi:hypothetical protein